MLSYLKKSLSGEKNDEAQSLHSDRSSGEETDLDVAKVGSGKRHRSGDTTPIKGKGKKRSRLRRSNRAYNFTICFHIFVLQLCIHFSPRVIWPKCSCDKLFLREMRFPITPFSCRISGFQFWDKKWHTMLARGPVTQGTLNPLCTMHNDMHIIPRFSSIWRNTYVLVSSNKYW